MKIIEIQTLDNGAHRNQTGSFVIVPNGWVEIPDNMEIPDTFPFVNLEIDNGILINMAAGEVPEPEPEPEPTPTSEEDTAEMLIDHEYRLTLLELGITE